MEDVKQQSPITGQEYTPTQNAAYFLAHLLTDATIQPRSFFMSLLDYKDQKDNSIGNKRKETSDFLKFLMVDLRKETNIKNQSPDTYMFSSTSSNIDDFDSEETLSSTPTDNETLQQRLLTATQNLASLTIDEKTGLLLAYNLFSVLRALLQAQKNTASADKINASEFMKALLTSLNSIIGNANVRFKKFSRKKEKEEKLSLVDSLISYIDYYLEKFSSKEDILKTANLNNLLFDSIQKLFDYAAQRELDGKSHPEKREQVYAVLRAYFTATKPSDYVKLFKLIDEGVKISRSKGEDKQKSRECEFLLINLRDKLLYELFYNDNYNYYQDLSKEDIDNILATISYSREIEFTTSLTKRTIKRLDADVCTYTMGVIDALEVKSGQKQNGLRLEHLKRLLLEIPEEINGQKVDKAQYCYDKGSSFAGAMATLLDDSTLSTSQKEEIGVLGHIWNCYMLATGINRKDFTADYMVPQIIGALTIKDHPLLPKSFKGSFEEDFIRANQVIYRLHLKSLEKTVTARDRSESSVSSSTTSPVTRNPSVSALTQIGSSSQSSFGKSEFAASQTQSQPAQTEEEKPWTYEEYCTEYKTAGYAEEQLKEGYADYLQNLKSNSTQLQN